MRVIKYIQLKKSNTKKFQEVKKYLSKEQYIYGDNVGYIVLKSRNSKKINQKFLIDKYKPKEDKSKIKNFLKRIILWTRIKGEGEKGYDISLAMLTHLDKSIKMFDFTKGVVITKYLKEDEYFKTIENYNYFKYYFKTPKLIEQNDDEKVVIEEFINYIPTSTLNKDKKELLINDIFKRYINYLKHNKNSITIKNEYPYIKSLGDLMYKNIFYKDDKFYYIDFELSNTNFILYDIFTFIFYAFLNNNETHYYKKYMSGSYDNYISQMFNISGIKYEAKKRIEYFNIFINERIEEEKKFSSDNIELTLLNKYNELKDKD